MKWVQNLSHQVLLCYAHHSANIYEDKMYVFGGINQSNQPTNELYEYSLGFNIINPQIFLTFLSLKTMEKDQF